MIMHMEALDHSFSTPSMMNPSLDSDCLGAQFANVAYSDHHYDSGNCSPMDSPLKQSYNRTPSSSSFGSDSLYSSGGFSAGSDSLFASSVSDRSDSMYGSNKSEQDTLFNRTVSQSSYGSDLQSSPCVDSQSDLSSFSSMSISSGDYPSTDSFSSPLSSGCNLNNTRPRQRKLASQANKNSQASILGGVPRRSSAPAKSNTTSRKDSFVYDVQLDSDNVLLFVPDLVSVRIFFQEMCICDE